MTSLFHYRVRVCITPQDRPAFDIHIEAVASNAEDACSFAEKRAIRMHPGCDVDGINTRKAKVK